MRSARSVRSLLADSHHTASTLDRVAQVHLSYATHSGVGDMVDALSAGRLRTLRGCIRLTSVNIGIDSCSIVMERLFQPNETTVTLLWNNRSITMKREGDKGSLL